MNEVARIKKILYCVKRESRFVALLKIALIAQTRNMITLQLFQAFKYPNRRKVWIAKLKRANLPKDGVMNIMKETGFKEI